MPTIGIFLATKLDLITSIYTGIRIFLLSSIIASLLLLKFRGALVHFGVCLTLSFLAFAVQDVHIGSTGILNQILRLARPFQNPALAIAYLSILYLLMIGFDIGSRKERICCPIEKKNTDSPEDALIIETDFKEEEKAQEDEYVYAT